jgi:hypothetical protein
VGVVLRLVGILHPVTAMIRVPSWGEYRYSKTAHCILPAALTALMFLNGCGGTSSEVPSVVSITKLEDIRSKYLDLRPRTEESVQKCMKKQGFDYAPLGRPDAPELRFSWYLNERTVEDGYGLATSMRAFAKFREGDLNLIITSKLTPDERVLWEKTRIPCLSAAEKEIESAPAAVLSRTAQSRTELIDSFISSNPEVKSLVSLWASCLRTQGLDYSSLAEPALDLAERFESKTDLELLEAEERRLAKVDLECRKPINSRLFALVDEFLRRDGERRSATR